MQKSSQTESINIHRGKASVWIEAEVTHWVACRIAEARGEPLPDPTKGVPHRLLRWPEVERMAGIKRGHAHFLIRSNRFPAPLKLPAAITKSQEAA
jgi:predicted DNA-binding transcriptional regulator AlpA